MKFRKRLRKGLGRSRRRPGEGLRIGVIDSAAPKGDLGRTPQPLQHPPFNSSPPLSVSPSAREMLSREDSRLPNRLFRSQYLRPYAPGLQHSWFPC